jgi:hypothetical protein
MVPRAVNTPPIQLENKLGQQAHLRFEHTVRTEALS